MKVVKILAILFVLCSSRGLAGQTVVTDAQGQYKTQLSVVINEVANFIRENTDNILEWGKSALELANGVLANWELAAEIWEIIGDLGELSLSIYTAIGSYENVNTNWTADQRWQLTLVVIEMQEERESYAEIFRGIIDPDGGIVMDDRGRISALREAYTELVRLRRKYRILVRQVSRALVEGKGRRTSKLKLKNLFRYAGEAVYVTD